MGEPIDPIEIGAAELLGQGLLDDTSFLAGEDVKYARQVMSAVASVLEAAGVEFFIPCPKCGGDGCTDYTAKCSECRGSGRVRWSAKEQETA